MSTGSRTGNRPPTNIALVVPKLKMDNSKNDRGID
jgi:hypothetical protein